MKFYLTTLLILFALSVWEVKLVCSKDKLAKGRRKHHGSNDVWQWLKAIKWDSDESGKVKAARIRHAFNHQQLGKDRCKCPILHPSATDQLNINLADFSLKLMRDVGFNGSNLFCSPLSTTIAMAMTLAGTSGNTQNQLKSVVFGAHTSEETINSAFDNILSDTLALPTSEPDTNGSAIENRAELLRLYIANQFFPSQLLMSGHKFYSSYLDRLRNTYKIIGDLPIINYADPINAAEVINNWVSEKTHGKIKDIVSAQSLDRNTAAVLVNAIYFKSPWLKPFKKLMTSKEKFYHSETDVGTPVQMMKMIDHFPYYADPNGKFNLALLPYANPNYNMFVILPTAKGGVNEVLKGLHGKELLSAIGQAQSQMLKLWLPKFKLDSEMALKPTLERMGVTDLFSQWNADFSRMSPVKLYVTKVQHKAVVEVNEEGTEAAAATAVIVARTSATDQNEDIVDFKVDHPFLFGIWEKSRNQIYFFGKLSNPT